MLARENHLFGGARSNPSQGSVPAGLTPAILAFIFNASGFELRVAATHSDPRAIGIWPAGFQQ